MKMAEPPLLILTRSLSISGMPGCVHHEPEQTCEIDWETLDTFSGQARPCPFQTSRYNSGTCAKCDSQVKVLPLLLAQMAGRAHEVKMLPPHFSEDLTRFFAALESSGVWANGSD